MHIIDYTKILEVNVFAFAYTLFRRDFSPLDVLKHDLPIIVVQRLSLSVHGFFLCSCCLFEVRSGLAYIHPWLLTHHHGRSRSPQHVTKTCPSNCSSVYGITHDTPAQNM